MLPNRKPVSRGSRHPVANELLQSGEQFLLNIRLSAIQECIKRTRVALLLCAFAALASLICVWNTALSTDRLDGFKIRPLDQKQMKFCDVPKIAEGSTEPDTQKTGTPVNSSENGAAITTNVTIASTPQEKTAQPGSVQANGHATPEVKKPEVTYQVASTGEMCTPGTPSELYDKMNEAFVARWMDSTYITIPVLGVSVSSMDFSVFNSCAMLFFSIYLLLSMRRENREVGSLLQDLHNNVYLDRLDSHRKSMVRRTVYRAICSFMIFNMPQHNDEPVILLDAGKYPSRMARTDRFIDQLAEALFDLENKEHLWSGVGESFLSLIFVKEFRRLRADFIKKWKKLPDEANSSNRKEGLERSIGGCVSETIKSDGGEQSSPEKRVVFLLRELIFMIFALPIVCLAVNLIFHLNVIAHAALVLQNRRLLVHAIAIELFEVLTLRYVIHLVAHTRKFHWATNNIISEFRDCAHTHTHYDHSRS